MAPAPAPAQPAASTAPWDRVVKMGAPYEVLGVWYTPRDERDYDATGIASWYGPGFHAKSTANGEVFDQDAISAAHKTLPMPSYVEVENLENGRRLVVRVNDRGPFVGDRVIDLSRRSAQLLGTDRAGLARVRVRRVTPDTATLLALRPPPSPAPAAVPLRPPAAVLARAVGATPVMPASAPAVANGRAEAGAGEGAMVQVAAVTDAGRAAWLAGFLSAYGPTRVERIASGLHRVRLGPFADRAGAEAALSRVRGAGYEEAWIVGSPAIAR